MRLVSRVEYKDGYADVNDARDVLLVHMRCVGLVGYGPEDFVVKRGNRVWTHNAPFVKGPQPRIVTRCQREAMATMWINVKGDGVGNSSQNAF